MTFWKHRSTLTLQIAGFMGQQWKMEFGSIRLNQLRVRIISGGSDFSLRVTSRDAEANDEVYVLFDSTALANNPNQGRRPDFNLTFISLSGGLITNDDSLRILVTDVEVGDEIQIDMVSELLDQPRRNLLPTGIPFAGTVFIQQVNDRDEITDAGA